MMLKGPTGKRIAEAVIGAGLGATPFALGDYDSINDKRRAVIGGAVAGVAGASIGSFVMRNHAIRKKVRDYAKKHNIEEGLEAWQKIDKPNYRKQIFGNDKDMNDKITEALLADNFFNHARKMFQKIRPKKIKHLTSSDISAIKRELIRNGIKKPVDSDIEKYLNTRVPDSLSQFIAGVNGKLNMDANLIPKDRYKYLMRQSVSAIPEKYRTKSRIDSIRQTVEDQIRGEQEIRDISFRAGRSARIANRIGVKIREKAFKNPNKSFLATRHLSSIMTANDIKRESLDLFYNKNIYPKVQNKLFGII